MDTITHGVAGALIAKSISDHPAKKLLRRAVIVGSLAPDLDLLAELFTSDELFQLEFHRGITHSVVALPVMAILLALLSWRREEGWRPLAGGYAVGLASHIFMDVITAYGTMILQPVSMNRYTLDMVFIIDLTLGSIVLVPQLVAWAWSKPGLGPRRAWLAWLFTASGAGVAFFLVNAAGVRLSFPAVVAAVSIFGVAFAVPGLASIGTRWPPTRYHRIGLAMAVLYLAACAVAHEAALKRVEQMVAKHQIDAQKIAALPAPPSLLNWSGLVQTADGITRIPIRLSDAREPSIERYVHSAPLPNADQLKLLPKVQTYLWFARFPWITTRETPEGKIVEYRDLQFMRPSPGGDSPFTFRVQFDPQGNFLGAGLSRR